MRVGAHRSRAPVSIQISAGNSVADKATGKKRRLRLALVSTLILLALFALIINSQANAQMQSDTIITRSVVVEEGDTFRTIARRELGKSGLSSMLANFNGMSETANLVAGQSVRVPLFSPVERQFATIIFVKGDVKKNDEPISRNEKVFLHELLSTGEDGFATIQFGSGSVVNLQPLTHAKLQRLNCLESDKSCLIELDSPQGEVSSNILRRDGQPTEFRINTPYASAAVRGTKFEMNAVSSQLLVGVTEGEVVLGNSSASLPLDVGFGTIAAADKPPADPIALLPAPVYRYIPTRAAKGDRISWWALSEVDQYLINLSSDENGREVVANFSEKEGAVTIEDLEAGEYHMNVRGIDSNGLKGFKSPTKIVIAAIDDSIEPVTTQVSRQGSEFLVKIVDPNENTPGYEIQISTTEDFSDPLSVDIDDSATALFRLESDKVFTRARILLDPMLVSAFGGVTASE